MTLKRGHITKAFKVKAFLIFWPSSLNFNLLAVFAAISNFSNLILKLFFNFGPVGGEIVFVDVHSVRATRQKRVTVGSVYKDV